MDILIFAENLTKGSDKHAAVSGLKPSVSSVDRIKAFVVIMILLFFVGAPVEVYITPQIVTYFFAR